MAKLTLLVLALAAMPALVAADGRFPFPSNTSSITVTPTRSASTTATITGAATRSGTRSLSKTAAATPAPETPTPATPTPGAAFSSSSSSGGVVVTTTGTFVLSGTNWATVLANNTLRAQATASLEADCSALFGGLTCRVTSLAVGSLVVQYEVTSTTVIDVASVVATATSSNSWLTNTAATYASSGATDSIGVTSFTAVSNTPTPASSFAAPKATWAWWWMVLLLPCWWL